MRRAYNQKVENQQLKVQELVVRFQDTQLMAASIASHSVILIGEPVDQVVLCLFVDDDVADVDCIAAASLSIVNSSDFNPKTGAFLGTSPHGRDSAGNQIAAALIGKNPGESDAVKVLNTQLAADDSFILKYIVTN